MICGTDWCYALALPALSNECSCACAWDRMLPPTSLLPGGVEWVVGLGPPWGCSLGHVESREDRPLPLFLGKQLLWSKSLSNSYDCC